jgi:hypothetical protein
VVENKPLVDSKQETRKMLQKHQQKEELLQSMKVMQFKRKLK